MSVWTAVLAGLAFTRQADLGAAVYAGRDFDDLTAGPAFQPAALAGQTGRADGFPLTAASRTGRHLHHRSQDGLANLADFTAAVAA